MYDTGTVTPVSYQFNDKKKDQHVDGGERNDDYDDGHDEANNNEYAWDDGDEHDDGCNGKYHDVDGDEDDMMDIMKDTLMGVILDMII